MYPVQEESGVCFHCSWKGTASLAAFPGRMPTSQAVFNVPLSTAPAQVRSLRQAGPEPGGTRRVGSVTSLVFWTGRGLFWMRPPPLPFPHRHARTLRFLGFVLSLTKQRMTSGRKKTTFSGCRNSFPKRCSCYGLLIITMGAVG